jgi:hypothetical protein
LKKAPWFTVACISPPGGKGAAKIESFKGKFLELEARFTGVNKKFPPTAVTSAKIKSFEILHRCVNLD